MEYSSFAREGRQLGFALPIQCWLLAVYLTWTGLATAAGGQFTAAGDLDLPRERHSAVSLSDGRLLVAGGYDSSRTFQTATWLYDPTNGWVATAPLASGEIDLSMTLLQNGKVLALGGYATGQPFVALYSAGLAGSGTWAAGAPMLFDGMTQTRSGQEATLLRDGRVLVVGGADVGGNRFHSAQLYTADGSTGSWMLAAAAAAPARNSPTATLLRDGTVLVVGGSNDNGVALSSVESYIAAPATPGAWQSNAPLLQARFGHTATLLPSGKVLVVGGAGQAGSLTSAELYDPATGAWAATGSLRDARYYHRATLLPCGQVLVTGGVGSGNRVVSAAELYNPSTGTWTVVGDVARVFHTASLTVDGTVLITGGDVGPIYNAGNVIQPVQTSLLFAPQSCLLKPCVGFGNGTTGDPFSGFVGNNVTLSLSSPGPSGSSADVYLRTKDGAGTSTVTAPFLNSNYLGEGSICLDVRLIEDGNPTSHDLHPVRLNLFGPSGFSAAFVGPLIAEDGGSNSGWHHVCAPIGPANGGALPSNGDGFWIVQNPDGTTGDPSHWSEILPNVTEFRLSAFDYQTNQDEIGGYDNVCVNLTRPTTASAVPALPVWALALLSVGMLGFAGFRVRRAHC